MQRDWNDGRDAYPFDGPSAERVVPADGDPEAEAYRARVRAREQMTANAWMWNRSIVRRTFSLRRLFWIGVAIVLLILFIKPLAVLATIALAALIAFAVMLALAVGAIFLAARFVLGGRYPTMGTRGPWRTHGFD
jgi:uncharacterized membrane protein